MLSLLPPIIAIAWVLWKKQVIPALLLALISSELLLSQQLIAAFIETIKRILKVFDSTSNSQVLAFSLLIGVLLTFMRQSGGINASIQWLLKNNIASNKRRAGILAYITGLLLFIESNLSVLTSGILCRGLFDRFGMSRERLAFIIDTTCAPVCIIILLNGWGAFILGLLNNYKLPGLDILLSSIFYNFYAWIALLIAFYVAVSTNVHGPLKKLEKQRAATNVASASMPSGAQNASHFVLPLLVLVLGALSLMYTTGDGDLRRGNGAFSILTAIIAACLVSVTLLQRQSAPLKKTLSYATSGIKELMPLVILLLVSMALGASLKELGTGPTIAAFTQQHLPLVILPASLFIVGAVMSFSTGTSWGTFAILLPIAVPFMQGTELPAGLLLGAVLSGGIFGDHCSPISDTTAVSSMAAGCDILDHVKTQLPYALIAGFFALLAFTISAFLAVS